MAVRTYDPQQVVITVDGTAIGGYADGTFISIEREEESFSKVVGADGAAARSKATNRSARITLTLMQTSPSNEFLSMLLARDERNNSGVFAVIVKDNSGSSRFFSATGWIAGLPTVEYGKEISNREWLIDVTDVDYNVAGNIGVGTVDSV